MFQTYRQITATGRVFFVGDLHGCVSELQHRLAGVDFQPEQGDLLVCTGDLIDRGTESLAALRLLDEPWFFSVAGNHEELALQAVTTRGRDANKQWLANGGEWFCELDDADKAEASERIRGLAALPLLLEVVLATGQRIGVAHATVPGCDWSRAPALIEDGWYQNMVLWDRSIWREVRVLYRDRQPDLDVSRVPLFTNIDAVVLGHNITLRPEPLRFSNGVWIDTGAFTAHGELTVLAADDVLALVAAPPARLRDF